MRRSLFVAVVVVMAALTAVAPVASAQNVSGDLAVASKNTSDSDFQNASLSNMTIEGSGTGASVSLTRTVDDFEDGDLNEYASVSSVGGATATVNSSAPVFSGTQSVKIDSSGSGTENEIYSTSGLANYPDPGDSFTVRMQVVKTGDFATALWAVQSESDQPDSYYLAIDTDQGNVNLGKLSGGSFNTLDSEPVAIPFGEEIVAHVSWGSGGQIEVTFEDGQGNLMATLSGSDTEYGGGGVGFRTTASDSGLAAVYDGFVIGVNDAGSYQATHSVSNPQKVFANLTLQNAEATISVEEDTGGSWSQVAQTTVSSTGNHTLDIPSASSSELRTTVEFTATGGPVSGKLHDEGILFNASAPTFDSASASPTGGLQQADQTLSINVSDTDLGLTQGDSVNVTFEAKAPNESSFSTVGSDTLTANGTANTSLQADVGGTWEWRATATDTYGESVTSQTFKFNAPATVTIRNEETQTLVTNANATIKFYSSDQIFGREDSDGDGNISMEGLPANEEFIATVSADDFTTRRVLISSLYEQQTVYLSPRNVTDPVNLTFQLDDQTGRFPPADTKLLIRAGINESGATQYKTISGDYFGAANSFPAKLVEDRRYRLVLETRDGDRRELGSFVPSASQEGTIVQLTVESGQIDLQEGETYTWDARLSKDASGGDIVFEFESATSASDLNVAVYERNNNSNEIYNNTVAETSGDQRTIPLNDSQANMTWVVEWSATLDGEDIGGERVVGSEAFVTGIPLSAQWQHIFSVLGMLVFGGLFGGIRGELGGIGLSVAGAVFLYMGWLPPAAGGLAIAAGLSISVAWLAATGVR